jgi:hypothetical protein
MALHGQQNLFGNPGFFPTHGLGNAALMDSLIAFNPIAPGGQIAPPPPNSCQVA